ncbi:hypothetical protein J3R82DRAFT_10502 [Butyriboletus roseoflavus]|nr:hypothetical protein J3R82DRAFT_10502 [Butyriboletus roseoflavus]
MASKPAKRQLSPVPLHPPKRQHGLYSPSPRGIAMSFDDALYDELVLFIFSFLNSRDLCAIQAANKNCSRLACDNQLWKTLFIRDFGKARLRGGKGFYGRTDDRLVKRLPSRASADDSQSLNWKWMYRISSNWRNESLGSAPSTPSLSQSPPSPTPRSHVLLAGALTISASSEMSHQPIILLRSRLNTIRSLKCRSSTTTGPVGISTIAIDQSRPSSKTSKHDGPLRFAAFLSTGEFSIYEYDPSSISPSPKLAYIPLPRHRSHVMHAAYHHPLLVTLSHTFTLMIYDLSEDTITHTHSLSSFTSHPPTSLILSAMPSTTSYKLVLAYAIPVYPAHWSVGVSELIISSSGSVTPTAALSGTTGSASLSTANFTVAGTRSARAFDVPQGWIDDEKLKAMRTQWGRKVKQVADTQTDGKWVVLAPGDTSESPPSLDDGTSSSSSSSTSSYVSPPSHTSTQLQLYRLYMPPFSSSHVPRLSFVRTLHGPLGPVSALSLADGRCVSLGVDGSIWVWDLEGGEGTEIAGSVGSKQASRRGTVMFDERRIVTSGVRGMEERRFDV